MSAFTAELTEAGASTWPSTIGGAARPASPRRFRASGRRAATPARPPATLRVLAHGHRQDGRLGRVPGTGQPGWAPSPPAITPLCAPGSPPPRALGSDEVWVRDQWSALAQLAALHSVLPEQVTSEQLDSGGDALLTAFRPPRALQGRPQAALRAGQLRATLFHAGMTDTAAAPAEPGLRRDRAVGGRRARPDRDRAALPRPARAQPAALDLCCRAGAPRVHRVLDREAPGVSFVSDVAATTSRPTSLARQPPPSRWRHPAPPHFAGTSRRCGASSTGSPNGTIPTRRRAR